VRNCFAGRNLFGKLKHSKEMNAGSAGRPQNGRRWITRLCLALNWLSLTVAAQTNNWTNPTSGPWESANWSLGELPGPGQAIQLTNSGWKAVAIGPSTTQNFPQTLNVDSVLVSSPGTDTVNVLLLNYSGLSVPLTAKTLSVGSNCSVVMDYASLWVTNKIFLSGDFTQDVSSVVYSPGGMLLGSTGPGVYALQGGSLFCTGTESIGGSFPSKFVQEAGTTNETAGVVIASGSSFDLKGGELDGTLFVDSGGIFNLRDGVIQRGSAVLVNGTFAQSGGVVIALTNNPMSVPHPMYSDRYGTVIQTGGTNIQSDLAIGLLAPPINSQTGQLPAGGGSFVLSNGVLATGGTRLGGNSQFKQWGGMNLVGGALNVQGALFYYHNIVNATEAASYSLADGVLSTEGIGIGVAADFSQSGGSNLVHGDLVIGTTFVDDTFNNGTFSLHGGLLQVSNIVIMKDNGFGQDGGRLEVKNLKVLGGRLDQTGGTVAQSGTLTLAGATLNVGTNAAQFGQLKLDVSGTTNSVLNFPAGPSTIQFQNSSSLSWAPDARLTIRNWTGNPTGGGNHRLLFGTNGSGLSMAQLSQIAFYDPAGLTPGTYGATLLPGGELVPGQSAQPNGGISVVAASDGGSYHYFGAPLAISGNTLVVGDPHVDSPLRPNAGQVYVYVWSGSNWVEQAIVTPKDAPGRGFFGQSVAIDGDTLMAGTDNSGSPTASGAVYVFVRRGTNWTQTAKLVSDATNSGGGSSFGATISLKGNTAVIGQPAYSVSTFVFTGSGSNWTQQAKLPGVFDGSAVLDDNTIVAGSPYENKAYVWVRNGTTWQPQAILAPATPVSSDSFGATVALSRNTAFLSAGSSVLVFERSGTNWAQLQVLGPADAPANSSFGASIAIANDLVLIGAPADPTLGSYAGAAYVYQQTTNGWTLRQKLLAPDGQSSDEFGSAVGLNSEAMLVGAPFRATLAGDRAGEVYSFALQSQVQTPLAIGISQGTNGPLQLRIQGFSGTNYAVQVSTDLRQWTPLTNQPDATGSFSIRLLDPAGRPAQFYRAVQSP